MLLFATISNVKFLQYKLSNFCPFFMVDNLNWVESMGHSPRAMIRPGCERHESSIALFQLIT